MTPVTSAPVAYPRLWLLRLVPEISGGRWFCGLVILALLLTLFAFAGAFGSPENWPAALFFCAILSYIVPIFHYVSVKTDAAFAELEPYVDVDPLVLERLRNGLTRKSMLWKIISFSAGVLLWFLHSASLAGGVAGLMENFGGGGAAIAMTLGPLPVWITMWVVTHSLVDNARTFRKLTAVVRLDLLDPARLVPFGSMATVSTLVIIGAQALFPIMWLAGETNPWTAIPGLLGTSLALVYLFLAPVWPLHKRLRSLKRSELRVLNQRISAAQTASADAPADSRLASLLTYRREILSVQEWPFDISVVARLGLYLFIVPLTWIGAALIENLVDLFIDG